MTADQLLTLITQSIFALLALLTLGDFALRRDRPRFDVALMFADLGLVVVTQWLAETLVPAPAWIGKAGSLLLVAHPYLLLRLVEHLRPVSRRVMLAALGGLLASWLAFLAPLASLPLPLTLLIVLYFVAVESFATGALLRGARQASGVSHARLLLAASGSGFIALVILTVGLSAVAPAARPVITAVSRVVSLLAALSYYLGFSPPNALRRTWQQAELYAFLRAASGRWTDPDPNDMLARLCVAAVRAVGGFAALAALADPVTGQLSGCVSTDERQAPTSLDLERLGLTRAWRFKRPEVIDLSRRGRQPQRGPAAELVAASRAGAVLAMPIATRERAWGLLLVFLWQVPLFAGDDLALLALFSEQAAVALSYVEMLAQQRGLIEQLQRGSRRLATLNEIDRAILNAQSPEEIAAAAVCRLRELAPCRRASVVLYDFATQQARIVAADSDDASTREPGSWLAFEEIGLSPDGVLDEADRYVDDLQAAPALPPALEQARDDGVRSLIRAPLVTGQVVVGELSLAADAPGAFDFEQREVARQVADSLAVAINNARLFAEVQLGQQQLQDLSRRLVSAQEDERRSIARELHDEAGQGLTSVLVGLGLLQRALSDPENAVARIEELKSITNRVMVGLHDLAANLRPAGLDRLGLVPALRQHIDKFAQQNSLSVEFHASGLDPGQRLRPEVEIAVYRLVQEALTNALRHAAATRVDVLVYCDDSHIKAVVEDNGAGFDVTGAMQRGRLGLVGMRERAEMLGGHLTIESQPGSGTTVFAEVPLIG